MKRTTFIFLLLIIVSSVFFSFYNLERLAHFGGDQARDAQIMWQIIVERKPTLIGPGVAGSLGIRQRTFERERTMNRANGKLEITFRNNDRDLDL